LECDKLITAWETGQSKIAIVDLSAGSSISRQKISAEAAIMNPLSRVVALRGNKLLFFYNMLLQFIQSVLLMFLVFVLI
jgi:clathrin heavy chain